MLLLVAPVLLAGTVNLQLTIVAEGVLYRGCVLQELNEACVKCKNRTGVPTYDPEYFSQTQESCDKTYTGACC